MGRSNWGESFPGPYRLVRQVVQSYLWLPLEGPSHSTLDCLSMKSDLDIGMNIPRAMGHEMPPQL